MRKLLYTIIAILTLTTISAQESKPRLTVIISVDGLQSSVLAEMMHSFNEKGIKRIFTQSEYSFSANSKSLNTGKTSHYASLMSGTTPSQHGIVSNKFFSVLDNKIIEAIEDKRYEGINTHASISPKNLMTTTIADEMKLLNDNSKVVSIALDKEVAIMYAGHTADAALWIDDNTGLVATSHYFENGLPSWAADINGDNLVMTQAKTTWKPSLQLSEYKTNTSDNKSLFAENPVFNIPSTDNNTFGYVSELKQSPHINDVIQALATRAIRDEQMGTDNATDLLCIEFNAKTPFDRGPMCAEIEDMYLRLDNNIRYLLDIIDLSVGMDNAIIIFTGYDSDSYSPELLKSKRISSGTFNAKRSMALLNSYLMAIYGQGKWISGYNARNIHLNRRLIEENRIKMSEIQEYVSQFMMEFTGVHSAISAHQLQYLSTSNGDNIARVKLSHFKNRSGDVIFNLLPGWYEVNDEGSYIGVSAKQKTNFPLFIMGYNSEHKNIEINIEDIVPLLCRQLNVPLPNGCN